MANSSGTLGTEQQDKRLKKLAEFPQAQRVIVESLLMPRELAYNDIVRIVAAAPTPLTQLQFDNAINDLVRKGYLSSFLEDGEVFYLLEEDLEPDKHDEMSHHANRPQSLLDTLDALDNLLD